MIGPEKNEQVKKLGEVSLQWKEDVLFDYSSNPPRKSTDTKEQKNTPLQDISELFVELCANPRNPLVYQIFDTTCHPMAELEGKEEYRFLEKKEIEDGRKTTLAFASAMHELKDSPQTKEQKDLVSGVAFWNLLLPRKEGGVINDSDYPAFLEKFIKTMKHFKPDFAKPEISSQLTPEFVHECLSNFKQFSLEYAKRKTLIREEELSRDSSPRVSRSS